MWGGPVWLISTWKVPKILIAILDYHHHAFFVSVICIPINSTNQVSKYYASWLGCCTKSLWPPHTHPLTHHPFRHTHPPAKFSWVLSSNTHWWEYFLKLYKHLKSFPSQWLAWNVGDSHHATWPSYSPLSSARTYYSQFLLWLVEF